MRARGFACFLLATLSPLLACGTGGQGGDRATSQSRPAQPASADRATNLLDFQAPKLGGGTVDGSDFAGQDVAMWFWAPW
jgi:hypothetical protein